MNQLDWAVEVAKKINNMLQTEGQAWLRQGDLILLNKAEYDQHEKKLAELLEASKYQVLYFTFNAFTLLNANN